MAKKRVVTWFLPLLLLAVVIGGVLLLGKEETPMVVEKTQQVTLPFFKANSEK